MSSFSCSSPATRQYEGKWWCFHHDPSEIKKKRTAREAKWKQEQDRDDNIRHEAHKLLKRLGVDGDVAYHWKLKSIEAVTISFEELEKLLKELGR